MVAVRTDLFCDFMVELRLLQQRNFFDAGVLSLPQQDVYKRQLMARIQKYDENSGLGPDDITGY